MMTSKTKYPGVYRYTTATGEERFRATWRIDANSAQQQKRGFPNALAASRHRAAMLNDAAAGKLVRTSSETFAELWAEWLTARRPYLAANTLSDYRINGVKRILPHFGPMKPAKIKPRDVRAWMTTLAEAVEAGELAPKTANNALISLTACCSWAVREGKMAVHPSLGTERLPDHRIEPEYLRLEEIPRYLDDCDPVYRPLAEVLIGTGMRISEALGLRWRDIDFDEAVIRVYRQARGDGARMGPTKTRRFRTVEIGPGLVNSLKHHRARQAEFVGGEIGDALVFLMPTRTRHAGRGRWASQGEPSVIDRNTVSSTWHKDALVGAGLRDMPLHSLRHTAAAAWLATGHPLIYVQRQLGHASITTTVDTYGHLERGFLQNAAARTEAAIEAAVKRAREAH